MELYELLIKKGEQEGIVKNVVGAIILNEKNQVLIMSRKTDDFMGGIDELPSGNMEQGENIYEALIREVKEETGLNIQNPKLCGVKDWVNSDGSRYIVFLYTCNTFTGDIISSNEGNVSWIKREDFLKLKLSVDMDVLIRVFEDPDITEFYYQKVNEEWNIHLK